MGNTIRRAMPPKGRRSATAFAAVLALAVVAGLSLFAVAASGSPPPPLTVTIDGAGGAAADAVATDQTYSAFKSAVATEVAGGTLTLPFSFQGAHLLTVTSAQVDYDDTDHAVAFTGTVTLPGFQGGETPGANGSLRLPDHRDLARRLVDDPESRPRHEDVVHLPREPELVVGLLLRRRDLRRRAARTLERGPDAGGRQPAGDRQDVPRVRLLPGPEDRRRLSRHAQPRLPVPV